MRLPPKTQGSFRIDTPAKITLHLEVLGRREDGYHEVRLVLLPVSLYDSLHVAPREEGRGVPLEVAGGEETGPPKANLVTRAVLAFQQATGIDPAIAVRLVKRIPAGAGLGGGSGNAGGLLMALNRIHGHPLAPDALAGLARGLGADVLFFLEPRPSMAEGIGERVRPLEGLPELPLLLVKPAFSLATGPAYRELDALPADEPRQWRPPAAPTAESLAAAMFNRFEQALFPGHPELAEIQGALTRSGACGARLSGSGSALFGIFSEAAARDRAAASLEREAAARNWRLIPAATLTRHRYDLVF